MVRALALFLILVAGPVEACRMALALGFDVSSSVDERDYAIQRDGLIAALRAPEIRQAFLGGEPVALAVFEWGGRRRQTLVVDWLLVRTGDDLESVIARVAVRGELRRWEPTAIGAALRYARRLLDRAPRCERLVLDMSGDGRNNEWMDPERMYEREDFSDIVVNGLAILGHEADIAEYYERRVIRGPGAFVEVADGHDDFPRAIRRKLERELSSPVLGGLNRVEERG